jgi:L-ascorbate metabolism protein UlaG (beta-lactamase superfamily)
MKIQFLGHSACLVSSRDKVWAIDPWLSGNPACPDSLKEPSKIDYIVLTHGHADHAGEASSLAKKYGSKIFAIYELGLLMMQEGVPESHVVLMNKGGTIEEGDFSVTLTHAFHSSGYERNGEILYAGEACGVVLKTPETTIYHAGDTALFSDMELISYRFSPEVCLLPIGDRFTMGPEDAVEAVAILQSPVVIPVHHSTFPFLTGTPAEFKRLVEKDGLDSSVVELKPGEVYER